MGKCTLLLNLAKPLSHYHWALLIHCFIPKSTLAALLRVKCAAPFVTRCVLNTRSYVHYALPEQERTLSKLFSGYREPLAPSYRHICCSSLSWLLCEHFGDVPGQRWVTLSSADNWIKTRFQLACSRHMVVIVQCIEILHARTVPSLCLHSSISVCFHLEDATWATCCLWEVISRASGCPTAKSVLDSGLWVMEVVGHEVRLRGLCVIDTNFMCLTCKRI